MMSDDDEDERDSFNPSNMIKIQKEIERRKQNEETRGMFVSGWDDDDEGILEEKHPHETPEKEILWAAEKGQIVTVNNLLKANSELVNIVDNDGYTPLHRACYNNHLEVVSCLLQHGAKIGARTNMGWEPLHSACQWNHPTCIALLLAAGADVHALSKGDQTPLHIATSSSHCRKMLQLLLLHPDVNAHSKNHSGDYPKDIARRQGIYDYLFELSNPAIDYIKSSSFTENPFMCE